MPNFGTKSALFCYFWARILKNYCHIWNQHLRISLIAKFCEETKMFKIGTKSALFWVFLGKNFKKTIVIFEMTTLKFVYLQNFTEKQKCQNLGPKVSDFGIFSAGVWKQYCHIWNQHPRICLIAKICGKTKMPKCGTQNASVGYFWARILKILLSYLKSAPSNFSNCKISRKNKNT